MSKTGMSFLRLAANGLFDVLGAAADALVGSDDGDMDILGAPDTLDDIDAPLIGEATEFKIPYLDQLSQMTDLNDFLVSLGLNDVDSLHDSIQPHTSTGEWQQAAGVCDPTGNGTLTDSKLLKSLGYNDIPNSSNVNSDFGGIYGGEGTDPYGNGPQNIHGNDPRANVHGNSPKNGHGGPWTGPA